MVKREKEERYKIFNINFIILALKILFDKTIITVGIIISGVFYATGGKDNLVFCLFGVMIIDYITGVISRNNKQ